MEFEPNEGQAPQPARFVARGINLRASLRPIGIDLSLGGPREGTTFTLNFVGANPSTNIVASDKDKSYSNYLLGNDPSGWLRHVPNFGRVTYKGIYQGIDAIFYGNGRFLEHDFVVTPGADYSQIRIRIEGAISIHLLRDGDLRLSLEHGAVLFKTPKTYQYASGAKRTRRSRFVVLGKNEFGFSVAHYDPTKTLIIDPVLTYSTYLAGVPVTMEGVATDSVGDTFLTGLAFDSTFPTTAGAYQPTCPSCGGTSPEPDVFIAKIDSTGSTLVYSTFLGGSNYDQSNGIAVDGTGNAVVVGRTESSDFPVKNAVPAGTAAAGGTTYGFVTSLSADGSTLNYSSILGGGNQTSVGGPTFVNAVALDSSGDAYITGTTGSPAFPTTPGALDNVAPNYPDFVGFVTKFLTTGALGYSALIGDATPQNGGGGAIGVFGIAVDPAGSAYITGSAGTLWPTTAGAYQTTIPGTTPYAAPFVTKLSADASALLYSTFIGSQAQPTGIAVEGNTGLAFITGDQAPPDFPTTPNAYLSSIGSLSASFLTELSADGSSLLYSTFIASNPATDHSTTITTGIALDGAGNIWLVGRTDSSQFPLKYPLQSLLAGQLSGPTATGFVSRFDPTGTTLTFSSFFGGVVQGGEIDGIAIDPLNQAHVAGTTGDDLFTTSGAYLSSVPPPPQYVYNTYGYAAVIDADTPAPSLCFSPQTVLWGDVLEGTSVSKTLTITNCGNAALTVNSVQSSSSLFTIPSASNGCQQSVAAGASCTVEIVFSPTTLGTFSATLTIDSNAPVSTDSVSLAGIGAAPQISVQPTSLTFDPQFIGQTSPQQSVLITNTGDWPLTIDLSQTTISAGFAYTQYGCDQPLGSCSILMTFTPQAAGTLTGTLNIVSDDPSNPVVSVALSGTGYSSYPVPTLTGLSSPTIQAGSTGATLTVIGTNFFHASVVLVGGIAQPTTYNNSTHLTAALDPSLLANMGELQVTVFNPSPGGGTTSPLTLTVYQSIPLEARDMVHDPKSGLLFASIGAAATNNPNTIAVIDPVAGKVNQYIPVGNDPKHLAVSDDGQYLYVALDGDHAIQRINLTTDTVDKTFALPVDSFFGQLTVADMKVVPGSPQSVVAALFRNASPAEDGIALFNSGGLVNWLANDSADGYVQVDSFAFVGNPPLVYSLPMTIGSPSTFGVFTIDSSGIHLQSTGPFGTTQQQIGSRLASDGTLLYTNSGEVWNPPNTLLGTYNPALFYAASVVPDDSAGRTFFLNPYSSTNQTQATSVDSYDQKSLDLVGSVPFLSTIVPDAVALNRWGTNGFAFLVDNFGQTSGSTQVILFRSSIANPSSGTNPAPVLTALSPSSVTAGSRGFVLGLQGSGYVSGSVVEWNGSPLGTTFVSTSQVNASIPAADIAQPATVEVTVVNPAPGGGTSSALPLIVVSTSTAATLQPSTLTFGPQNVGTQSAAQTVTLQNTGLPGLMLTGIQASGDFAETDDCPASLASLATCTISVTFTPTAAGTRQGAITIADNAANSPQTVPLSGTGSASAVSLTPTSVKFANQLMGTTSAAQKVTLTNSGNAALSVSAIATTGDFAETNNCGTSLAAGANCSVDVTFTPTVGGNRAGSLTFTDNAADSPQNITLSGTGEDFTVGVTSGSSAKATVTAGGTATYSVSVAPEGGFNQTVAISCSGAPSLATCSISPSSVTPDGTNPAKVSITVSTTAASAIPLGPAPAWPLTSEKLLLLGVGLVLLAILGNLARPQPRRAWLGLALTLAFVGMLAACGGGGPASTTNTSGGSHSPGTPAGTYSLTVSGSDGSLTHSTTLTLTVQ